MSEPQGPDGGTPRGPRAGLDGIRAAMYAEMAKAAAGDRPGFGQESGSGAAVERAIRFIHTSGLGEPRRRQLLGEVSATRRYASEARSRRDPAGLLERLAAEFRWRVRHR